MPVAHATEITSGGSFVYGYNWNAKTAATGKYRLTFVLDGIDDVGSKCTTLPGTKFESGVTRMVHWPGSLRQLTPTARSGRSLPAD